MFRHVSAIHSTPVYLLESWARPHCQPMRSASLGENPPGPNSFHPKNTGKSNISSPRWWKFLIHPPQLASQQSSITGQPTYPSHKNTIITLNIVALHTQTWRSLWISHLKPSNLELQSNCACGASQESRGKHDVTRSWHGILYADGKPQRLRCIYLGSKMTRNFRLGSW